MPFTSAFRGLSTDVTREIDLQDMLTTLKVVLLFIVCTYNLIDLWTPGPHWTNAVCVEEAELEEEEGEEMNGSLS